MKISKRNRRKKCLKTLRRKRKENSKAKVVLRVRQNEFIRFLPNLLVRVHRGMFALFIFSKTVSGND
jgi:hypothetical protein